MKKVLLVLIAAALGAAVAQAQTTSLPGATSSSISVPLSGGTCTTSSTCAGQVYYIAGACPATLTGSTGWTAGPTFTEPGTASVTITSGIGPNAEYSVDVEATPTGSPAVFSGPSNCASITTPFHPAPLTVGTLSAT